MGKFTGLGTYISALSKSTQRVNVKATTRRTASGKTATVRQHTATRKRADAQGAESRRRKGFGQETDVQFRSMKHKEFWLQYGLPKYMRKRLCEAYVASASLDTGAAKKLKPMLMKEYVENNNTDVLVELRKHGVEPLHTGYLELIGVKINFGHPRSPGVPFSYPW